MLRFCIWHQSYAVRLYTVSDLDPPLNIQHLNIEELQLV